MCRLGLGAARLLGSVQVDVLEEARARVVHLETGRAEDVARAALPPGVREGDVVVEGRRDAAATRALRRAVHARRSRLAAPLPARLELDAPAGSPLTGGRER